MYSHNHSWVENLKEANADFHSRIDPESLPVQRTPGSKAVVTCMDPRVNLDAIGIKPFLNNGKGDSSIRIIRTVGGMIEERSLIIGCYLAGISELLVLMHTDCGCCLAFDKMDLIIENMKKKTTEAKFALFEEQVGEPFKKNLQRRLKVFQDPYQAVRDEVQFIRSSPYISTDLIVHGMVYNLETGRVTVEVNGD